MVFLKIRMIWSIKMTWSHGVMCIINLKNALNTLLNDYSLIAYDCERDTINFYLLSALSRDNLFSCDIKMHFSHTLLVYGLDKDKEIKHIFTLLAIKSMKPYMR